MSFIPPPPEDLVLTWDREKEAYVGIFSNSTVGTLQITLQRINTFADINKILGTSLSEYRNEMDVIVPSETNIVIGTYTTTIFGAKHSIRICKAVRSPPKIDEPLAKRLKISEDSVISDYWKYLPEASEEKGFIKLIEDTYIVGEESLGSGLYIREAYIDLWNIINTSIGNGYTQFAVLGTSGIGKTFFLYYILWKMAKSGKTIILSKKQKTTFDVFQGDQTFECTRESSNGLLSKKENWYLVDSEVPLICNAITIYVSSPSPKVSIGKHLLKSENCIRLYMPVWTTEEVTKVGTQLRNYQKARLLALYEKWGGVARRVFNRQEHENPDSNIYEREILESEILNANPEEVMKASVSIDKPPTVSDVLVHYQQTQDYLRCRTCFASRYVADQIYIKLAFRDQDRVKSFLKESFKDPGASGFRGTIFERYAHANLTRGGIFRYRKLGTSEEGILQLVERKEDMFDGYKGLTLAPNNVYSRPKSMSFAAIDAVIKPTNIFQITVSETHPIIQDSLLKVTVAMGGASPFRLFFVVPEDIYKTYGVQKYLSTKNEVLMNQRLDTVEQYALEICFSVSVIDQPATLVI